MKDWQTHWQNFPQTVSKADYLKQVGKTVNGQSISEQQFKYMIQDIFLGLSLKPEDDLLDLCCGNGLITSKLSANCRAVLGVDYSQPLVAIAEQAHCPDNVTYSNKSVLDLNPEDISEKFSKVLMYEALQHFSPLQLDQLLEKILPLLRQPFLIYIGSIPDVSKKWFFYDTWQRKVEYFKRLLNQQEAIGYWWHEDEIDYICNDFNLNCQYRAQHPSVHTAHYRFDVLIYQGKRG